MALLLWRRSRQRATLFSRFLPPYIGLYKMLFPFLDTLFAPSFTAECTVETFQQRRLESLQMHACLDLLLEQRATRHSSLQISPRAGPRNLGFHTSFNFFFLCFLYYHLIQYCKKKSKAVKRKDITLSFYKFDRSQ